MVTDRSAAALTTAELKEVGPAHAAMFIPLRIRERTFGVMTLIMAESERRHTDKDFVLALEVSRRASVAIDNARLYRAAQRAVKTRDDVLAIASHDLNNALSTVMLGVQRLVGGAPPGDRQYDRKALEAIGRGSERMSRLIGDLVDVSSLEAGLVSIELHEQSVAGLLSAISELFDPVAQAQGIEFAMSCADAAASVACDRARLLQVLSNLVGDAIKFTPRGGRVTLQVESLDDTIRFAVSDNGPGIHPDQLPHVFERYWRAGEEPQKGLGLGLYIAKSLAEAQRGTLDVQSTLGKGSTFNLTLPRRVPVTRSTPTPAAKLAAQVSVPRHPHAAGRLILVIDDDPDMRDALAQVLQSRGYSVAVASHGEEAIAFLGQASSFPALVLLDLQMPVMDGSQLLRVLKSDPVLATIPVVLISGQQDTEHVAKALGAAAHLKKPLQPSHVLETVESFWN